MKIENINDILFSPLLTSNLVLYFLSGTKNNKIKIELIYFVLPIIYNSTLRNKLLKCKSSSSLKTFLTDDIKIDLIDLSKRMQAYNTLTNESIITLSNYIKIEISDFLSIQQEDVVNFKNEKNEILREYYKSAFYLGLIFSKEDYKTIFYKF